jgi:ribosomal protein L7/L12
MTLNLVAGIAAGVLAAIILIVIASLARRLDRLSRMEAKIDTLLAHAGAVYDPLRDVPPDVIEAVHQGETILAVKRYREATGAGLKEAKDFVDEVRARRRPTP